MPRLRALSIATLWGLSMLASACGPAALEPTQVPMVSPTGVPSPTNPPPTKPAARPTIDFEHDIETLDAGKFANPTAIDNKFFPLQPGIQYVYSGFTTEAEKSIPHSIVFTVTDLTKEIAAVRTVVAWILDYSDGKLVEAEIAFYAQDNDGNVWYLGEYPEVYENGQLVETPAWIPGFKGARAGIVMKADPQPGTESYAQGWGPAVAWADRGQVIAAGKQVCVPVACYEDVLVTEEFSQSEPDAFQVKYYAPHIGNVMVGWRGSDASKEILQLTELNELSADEMASVRAQALELERRAYSLSKEVYDQTRVSEYPPGTPAITVDLSLPPPVEMPTAPAMSAGSSSEVVAYASEVPESALFELGFLEDPSSPGGKLIGLPNNGNELDPPPQNDPYVAFRVKVRSGIAYRCWIHMKVGTPQGNSSANVIWVQASDAFDKSGKEMLQPGSSSYLTAQGPAQAGWHWVGCNLANPGPEESLVYFHGNGEITVRLQAGMEGVGYDQFLLSPEKYLENPPSEPVVEK